MTGLRKNITVLLALFLVAGSSSSQAFLGGLFSGKESGAEDSSELVEKDASMFLQGKPSQLKPFYRNLWLEGERNAVLNLNYLGLAAMEVGEFDVAKSAYDESIFRIEAIYADDPNAEKAKSLWNEEKVKDFKGEPYERAMTYYYRGLLYARDGDFQNARASFLSADRHDTLSEQEKYQGDFGLMNYLAAWSSYCDGDNFRAKELHSRASSQDSSISSLSFDYAYLVLVDAGIGPEKTGMGQYKEILTMVPSKDKDEVKAITTSLTNFKLASDQPLSIGNIAYQATTRGGRPIQGILNGKAQFKENADAIGTAAMDVGQVAMMSGAYGGNDNVMGAGAIMTLFGAVSKIAAAATTPSADTRAWSSLPDSIYFGYAEKIPSTSPDFRISYQSGGLTKTSNTMLSAKNGKCGLTWGRTRSALSASDGGTAKLSSNPEVLETKRGNKNKAFRAMLAERFQPGDLNKADSKPVNTSKTDSAINETFSQRGDQ